MAMKMLPSTVCLQGLTPGAVSGQLLGRPGMQSQQLAQRSPLLPASLGLAAQHGTRVVSGSRPVRVFPPACHGETQRGLANQHGMQTSAAVCVR